MRNYLTFDNKDSRDFGVYINGQGTFRAPARSYNVLNIPGRNGDLLGFGSKLENVEITYRAFIYTNFDANIAALRSFLLSHVGYFKLTDSYHPDEYRLAYYKGPFVPDVVANNGAGSFDLTFVCKPQRFLNSGEEVTTLTPAGAEQHTYQGEIVNFSTLAGDKITSARADFHPIQDLHGYDSPWPAGGGVNAIDPSQFPVTISGVAYVSIPISQAVIQKMKTSGCAMHIDGTLGENKTRFAVYAWDGTNNDALYIGNSQSLKPENSLTLAGSISSKNLDNVTTLRIYAQPYTGNNTSTINNVYFQVGTDTSVWYPYSNICPITGRTGLSVYRTGKNLLNVSDWEVEQNSGLTIIGDTIDVINKGYQENKNGYDIPFIADFTLSFHVKTISTNDGRASFAVYVDGVKSVPSSGAVATGNILLVGAGAENDVVLHIANGAKRISFGGWDYGGEVVISNIQLELGLTSTAYEPFGTTYSVTWQTEAGTVYGGTLDVVTGVLTVDRASRALDGTEAGWQMNVNANHPGRTYAYNRNASLGDILTSNSIISSYVKSATFAGTDENSGIYVDSGYLWVRIPAMREMTAVADWTTYLSNNPLQVCYELATPLTYQLTGQEIEALADNYMWSDVGQVTVTVTDAMTIENPTLFDAKPLLRVYGAGTLTLGGQTITISTADVYTDIDCEMMDCFKDTVSKNGNVSFSGYDFPVIPPGRNVITMDGVTQVDITPRWWAA